MDKPKTELADLNKPVEEFSPEQATDVRGGLFTTGLSDTSLGASATQTSTSGTSSKPSPSEIPVTKTYDKGSP